MKNTRRTFLQSLAPVPLLGWVATPAKPAMPSLPPVRVDTSKPVYGFDERITLGDFYPDARVLAGEKIKRGDLVAFTVPHLNWKGDIFVMRAQLDQQPIGVAVKSLEIGQEVGNFVLVRGCDSFPASSAIAIAAEYKN